MEYKIISTSRSIYPNLLELERLVKKGIEEGWKPIGGPQCIQNISRGKTYVAYQIWQAMIREDEEKKEEE